MEIPERYGFSQFFYIMLCSHLEAFLTHRIRTRMYSVQRMLHSEAPEENLYTDHECKVLRYDSVFDSIKVVAEWLESDVERLSLSKLLERYDRVFTGKVKDVLGASLRQDVEILGGLRNVYAHGQDFIKYYENEELTTGKNPFIRAVTKLVTAKKIKDPGVNDIENVDFVSIFSQDEVMRHFYHAVQEAERRLGEHHPFEGERNMGFPALLPALD